MAARENHGRLPLPQGEGMRNHVMENTSARTGQLEDQSLDLDARTMIMLGKRQRLNRNFGLVSLVAFSTTLIASWESIACTFQDGLINGGPATLIYGLLLSWLGSLATCASMAEMASMLPTSGGQYHWVAELAPTRLAIKLSWLAGWVSTFARLAVCASAAYVAGQMVQGLIILNVETYEPLRWQGTLLYWAVLLVAAAVNILGIRFFPHIETVAFIFHICFFFVLLVPLVYLSPQSSAAFVFADFENAGGWSSNGVSWCIGLLTSAWSFVGIDGTGHMAEEVKDSARVVPQSMVLALCISGVFTMAFSVVLLFCVGDLMTVLQSPSQYPIIQIIYTATSSKAATTAMVCGLVSTLVFATFGTLASASRLVWAFARDNGFPFSQYFAHVNSRHWIPIRAILLIVFVALLLGLVNIGSSTAFNALTSLALIGSYASYVLPISLMIIRRFGAKEIPWGPFCLGRWGLPINIFSLAYSLVLIVFMTFPPYQPVTAMNMNYSSVIFGAVLLCSWLCWWMYGKKVYGGPVREMVEDSYVKM